MLCSQDLSHSTVSLYLQHLVEEGIVERVKVGYENIYSIREVERVTNILAKYKISFSDKMIDRALNTWAELL